MQPPISPKIGVLQVVLMLKDINFDEAQFKRRKTKESKWIWMTKTRQETPKQKILMNKMSNQIIWARFFLTKKGNKTKTKKKQGGRKKNMREIERERERHRESVREKKKGRGNPNNFGKKNKGRHWQINKNVLLHGENKISSSKNEKKQTPPKTKRNKPNQIRMVWGPKGHLTWPLKPSEKETNRPKQQGLRTKWGGRRATSPDL